MAAFASLLTGPLVIVLPHTRLCTYSALHIRLKYTTLKYDQSSMVTEELRGHCHFNMTLLPRSLANDNHPYINHVYSTKVTLFLFIEWHTLYVFHLLNNKNNEN